MILVGQEREKMLELLLILKRNESKVNEEKNERLKLKRKFKIWLYQNLEMVYNKISFHKNFCRYCKMSLKGGFISRFLVSFLDLYHIRPSSKRTIVWLFQW